MGETKKTGRRRSSGNILLILVFILILAVIGLAVYIAPRIGGTFAEYKTQRASLKTVRKELKEEQSKIDEKTALKQKIESDKEEIENLRTETFTLAAQLEQDIEEGRNKRKICYLTIDDGPYYRGQKILEILNQYDVRATFFLTTANGNKLPDKGELTAASMYPEYLKYGHTIGNHTYSHDYGDGIYSSVEAFMADVKKQEDFTAEATGGYRPQIVRFPGGRGTAGSKLEDIEEALRAEGYGWIDWTVDSGDSWGTDDVSPELILEQVKDAAKEQDIMVVLCHEWSKNTQKALPEMIEYLQSEGYIFLPLFYESTMVYK